MAPLVDSNLEATAIQNDPRVPIIEPVLPVMDEWARDIIMSACFKEKESENEGEPNQTVCEYPDILLLASIGVGHLEGLSKLTWEQGMSYLFDWEGYNLDPLLDKYWRNPEAIRALRAIQSVMKRQIVGGSIGGSHQDFLVRYRGADRSLKITRDPGGER